MKDSTQASTSSSDEYEDAAYKFVPRSFHKSYETSNLENRRVIHEIVTRYVGQLLYGCGDSSCTERLCDTGLRNTSKRPIRKYTPRSARAIALTLASGPKPRFHLCPRYTSSRQSEHPPAPEGPQDPTSFMQKLCDTQAICSFGNPLTAEDVEKFWSSTLVGLAKRDVAKFPIWWRCYAHGLPTLTLWRYQQTLKSLPEQFHSLPDFINEEGIHEENESTLHLLSNQLEFLFRHFPKCLTEEWDSINAIISSGYAYPHQIDSAPDPYIDLLDVLDALDYRPWLEFTHCALGFLARLDAMEQGTWNGSSISAANSKQSVESENLRLCSAWRVFNRAIKKFDPDTVYGVMVWLKKIFLRSWDGHVRVREGTVPSLALNLLGHIMKEVLDSGSRLDLLEKRLQFPVVAQRLDAVELAQTWLDEPGSGHLLGFGFLFNTYQETMYFRTMNHLRMRRAISDAEIAENLRDRCLGHSSISFGNTTQLQIRHIEEHYLLLHVSRGNVLQDAFDQLWQRRRSELLRPLRVRLGETDGFEVGHDLGGVQIEFFNLVCKELLNESAQIFTTDPATGLSYFCPGSLQPLYMFELCGLLFALALYNGISLPVNFPRAFYQILTSGESTSLELITDGWPIIKKSLETILNDDVSGLERTFPLEANGLRLTVLLSSSFSSDEGTETERNSAPRIPLAFSDVTLIRHHQNQPSPLQPRIKNTSITSGAHDHDIDDAWPGWHAFRASEEPEEITQENKAAYVQDYLRWLTFGCVEPQWNAFLKGFHNIFADVNLQFLRHLQLIVEGSRHFDMSELRDVTSYDGYDPNSSYIRNFWHLVTNWPEEKQKKLLKFVTACERVPPGGARNLTFKIHRLVPDNLENLPTSSTCFGILILPKYTTVDMLDKKLSLALKYGVEGFGTG